MRKFLKQIVVVLVGVIVYGISTQVNNNFIYANENNSSIKFNETMNGLKVIVDKNLALTGDKQVYLSNEKEIRQFIKRNMTNLQYKFQNEEQVVDFIQSNIIKLNNLSKLPGHFLTEDKVVITISDRAVGVETTNHWWGKRHIAPTDNIARELAREFEINAQKMGMNTIVTGVVAHFFPPVWMGTVVGSVGVWYFNNIASTIRYNASLDGAGVTLDINHWLTMFVFRGVSK